MEGDMQAARTRGVGDAPGRQRQMRLATILAVAATEEEFIWKSKGQKGHVDGAVTFHKLGPNLTRIVAVPEYHPRGMFERTGAEDEYQEAGYEDEGPAQRANPLPNRGKRKAGRGARALGRGRMPAGRVPRPGRPSRGGERPQRPIRRPAGTREGQ